MAAMRGLLDNRECVAAACATLATGVLSACPSVTILATSRAALGTPSEAIRRVLSLSPPAPA